MSELPEGWCEASIDEINSYKSSNINPANYPNEKFELYSVPVFPTDRPEKILGDEIGSNKYVVQTDDVLLCKINPRINRVWRVKEKKELQQIASSEWIVIRQEQLYSRYLQYYFSTQNFRELLCSEVSGVGGSLTRAQPKKVGTYTIKLAPLNEQKRIAEKLDQILEDVNSTKARLDQIPKILKSFRQSVIRSAVTGHLTRNREMQDYLLPSEWKTTSLSEIGELARGKSKHRPRNDVRLFGGLYPFIQTGDIANSNQEVISHSQTYSEFGLRQSRLFPKGTLCITIAANIADTAVLTYPACFPDSVVGFIADTEKVETYFIKYFIDSLKTDLELHAPATAQKNINLKILRELSIPLPDLEEQREIVKRVRELFSLADQIEEKYKLVAQNVDKITQGVLAKAFRGDLIPQDPNDEPAYVLLERIKAEKSTQRHAIIKRKNVKNLSKDLESYKMILSVQETLKKEGKPLTAQSLLQKSGYPLDADPEKIEEFFLDIRNALQEGSIIRERVKNEDIFRLAA